MMALIDRNGRIEGALDPWMTQLSAQLLAAFPLLPGLDVLPDTIPAPRVSVVDGPNLASLSIAETDEADEYLSATLTKNERITAKDWFQDVRHLDFDFDEDAQGADDGDVEDADGEEGEEGEDKSLYCFCQKLSYGEMIACDNPACTYQWASSRYFR